MNETLKAIIAGMGILLPIALWNYLDEPSREFWQGRPEKYYCVYFKQCPDAGDAGVGVAASTSEAGPCCRCCP